MRTIPYGFARTGDGSEFTEDMRLAYRAALDDHEKMGFSAPPNPFAQADEFLTWFQSTRGKEIASDERRSQTNSLIQTSLGRAQQKQFVKSVKPLRRIFRNQGAVNDSLIEAVHQLALQNQDLAEEMRELGGVIRKLRNQLPLA